MDGQFTGQHKLRADVIYQTFIPIEAIRMKK